MKVGKIVISVVQYKIDAAKVDAIVAFTEPQPATFFGNMRNYLDDTPTVGKPTLAPIRRGNAIYRLEMPGPRWVEGETGKMDELAGTIRACLSAADDKYLTGIAFGSEGLASLGYPARLLAHFALRTAAEYARLHRRTSLRKILFALHDPVGYGAFKTTMALMQSDTLVGLPNLTGEDKIWKI
jgi:O-acetyl-ADP-ribose deacetylase (regulator of RNase III)